MALAPVKGFAVTFKQLFKKPITQQYPDYKRPLYPRFRGRHRLNRFENGLEKCVGCSLCAAACPADCIRVVPAENTPDNRVSAGERYARIYEINMSRCIFCGYCELACPFDAITLGNEFEISEYIDAMTLAALGLEEQAVRDYIRQSKPTYPQFEAWVKKNAKSLNPDAVKKHNASVRGYNHDDETRKSILGACKIADDASTPKDAVNLNNLDDWYEFHQAVLA